MKQRLQALLLALLLTASLTLAGCAKAVPAGGGPGVGKHLRLPGGQPLGGTGRQPARLHRPGEGDTQSFEDYTPLDALGRCGVAYANLSPELMPTQERGGRSAR